MSLETRVDRLEAERRERCAVAWHEMVTRLSKLPLPVIKQLMETGTAPIEYGAQLDAIVALYVPGCEAYAQRVTP